MKIKAILLIAFLHICIYSQPYIIDDFIGNWDGSWTNNTFGSTGSATMTITSDPNNMAAQMMLDMNGNVLGGADPDPMTLNGNYTDTDFTVKLTDESSDTVTATIIRNKNIFL